MLSHPRKVHLIKESHEVFVQREGLGFPSACLVFTGRKHTAAGSSTVLYQNTSIPANIAAAAETMIVIMPAPPNGEVIALEAEFCSPTVCVLCAELVGVVLSVAGPT
jgi:hypothetical protein